MPRFRIHIFIMALLCLLNISCGRQEGRITGEFESYLVNFEGAFSKFNDINIKNNGISIEFGKLNPSQLAVCEVGGPVPKIIVNSDQWGNLTPATREIVMFHEFGHCILRRPHNTNKGVGRLWESLMAPYPQRVTDYLEHKDGYLKELFLGQAS